MAFKKGFTPWNKGIKVKGTHPQMGFQDGNRLWDNPKTRSTQLRKGGHHSTATEFKHGHIPWSKGRALPDMREEKNPQWKGQEVSYRGLHKWVEKKLGKPRVCSSCKENNLTGHRIHWANKSKHYKRITEDWLRLCVKCHKKYDTRAVLQS